MSRRFRALAVWTALKAAGRAGYQAIVERCLANATAFAAWVEAAPGLELMAPLRLNIVCFRYAPAGRSAEATDELNRAAVAALQSDGHNWATGPADVAILQEAVADIGHRLSES
jgi:glutamate/tyrosine decarboxylase-like PLP-dependent enzyme